MEGGLVKSKYRVREAMPGIRSLTKQQKENSRLEISNLLGKIRNESLKNQHIREFTNHCVKVSLDMDRLHKLKLSKNPHCLLLMPQIGGDPHLVVLEESEWLKHMNGDCEEIVGTKSIEISGEQKTPQMIQAPTLIPEEPLVQFKISDPFSASQMEYIRKSRQQRESLHRILCGSITGEGTYRHLILSGPPGLGKTHFVRSFFELRNTPIVRITGAVSLFSLGIKLAVIMANCDPNEVLYIHIDDADVAFRTEEGCNLLKQMLFDERAFVYEKNIGPLLLSFPSEVREAVEGFRTDGSLGFRVPLINVVFIVTTNIPLPADKDVRRHMGGNGHSGILVHRNAIRSRCRYRTLDFNNEQRWAWIADAFMEDGELRRDQNFVIKSMLDFLWEYRAVTQELTMRAAEKMLIMAKEHPTHYYQEWRDEFLWQLN
jgi:hypothetical protein